jgi:ssDNA-binding Zn-finger/Zn-ribbon topoisomerase 1
VEEVKTENAPELKKECSAEPDKKKEEETKKSEPVGKTATCPKCGALVDFSTGGGSSAVTSGSGTQAATPNEPALGGTPAQTVGTGKGVWLTEAEWNSVESLRKDYTEVKSAYDSLEKRVTGRKGLVAQTTETVNENKDPRLSAFENMVDNRRAAIMR